MRKIFFTFIFFSVILPEINGQPEYSVSKDLAEWMEDAFSKNSKGEADAEQFLYSIQLLSENPININSSDTHELSSLMFLDKFRIQALIDYREKNGEILSIYELVLIPGFDKRIARMIEPFICFGDKRKTHFKSKGHHEIVLQGNRVLEEQKGYKEPRSFDGSPDKISLRYRYSSKNISAGYTADKDPGETFFKSPNKKGFDFNSGFLQISPNENNTIFLGDYVVRFGQGLVAWQGFSLGGSSQPMSMAKFNQGIKSYSSSGEYGFMRGIAFSGKYGKFSVMPFFSCHKVDASINTVDDKKVITSFPETGYHRTSGEIDRKNAASVLSTGSRVSFDGKCYSVSINGYYNHYQYPVIRKNEYNRYYFNGNSIGDISVDYQYSMHKFFLYGELATNFDRGWAYVSGVMANPTDKLEFLAA
ncbi:MAG: helix-hairpin-helix domain-containing protein, partial [Prolixibacteraceae bacterium]|nr:helix-hairpin-helix domain-containing protein [Prolixibacteraceae bacterium]